MPAIKIKAVSNKFIKRYQERLKNVTPADVHVAEKTRADPQYSKTGNKML
jgi:hypothetical protein